MFIVWQETLVQGGLERYHARMTPEHLIVALSALSFCLILTVILLATRRGRSGGVDVSGLREKLDHLESMAGHVADLHRFMLLPGARGAVGEALLAQLLQNWLPAAAYRLQHTFRNGARADAVILMGGNLVAVDAKFPREAVERSMHASPQAPTPEVARVFQKQIDEIAQKYIRPEEGTLSFAMLYCPSEAHYRYLFADGGLLEAALRGGVVPVSPSTLFAYLQTVSYGLRGLAMDADSRALVEAVHVVRREFERLTETYQRATAHLRNAAKAFTETDTAVDRTAAAVEHLERGSTRGGGGT